KKSLAGVSYYIDVVSTTMGVNRTPQYAAKVASGMMACHEMMMATPIGSAAVVLEAEAGAPLVPAGFSASGVTAATGAVAGVAAGAASAGVAAGGGHLGTILLAPLGAGAAAGSVVAATHTGQSSTVTPGTWGYTVAEGVPLKVTGCTANASGTVVVSS